MAVNKEVTVKANQVTSANGKVAFAKLLAGNDKKVRDKGLKKLKRWLCARSTGDFAFTDNDLTTIWVGLFYSMWMSDMPLIQEELAESLSSLVHCFNSNHDAALLFIKCFCRTMNNTWATLDQYRIDKFAMLVRRFLRQSLVWLANREWPLDDVLSLMDVYKDTILSEKAALGLKLQFIDVFLEELAKVSKGKLQPKVIVAFCSPFTCVAATTRDSRVRLQLDKFFRHLLKQTDISLDHEDKFEAWKRAGCPGGDINAMQLVLDNDDPELNGQDESEGEEEKLSNLEGPWDPRAGSVHVSLPQITLPPLKMAKMARGFLKHPTATLKGKRMMLNLRRQFRKLDKGQYPFAVKKIGDNDPVRLKQLVNKAVKKSAHLELKQSRKRADTKKKLRKLKKIGVIQQKNEEEIVGKAVEEIKPVTVKKSKKRKRSEGENPSPSPKKPKTGFAVSDVPKETEHSPVGAKRINGSSDAELELPPGWIVERAEVVKTKEQDVNGMTNGEPAKKMKSPEKKAKLETLSNTEANNKTNGSSDDHAVVTIKNPHIFFERAVSKVTPKKCMTPEVKSKVTPVDPNLLKLRSGRRISFNLQRNMAQEKDEYFDQIQRSPQIPFDAALTPKQSALKAGLAASPINPFYERLLQSRK